MASNYYSQRDFFETNREPKKKRINWERAVKVFLIITAVILVGMEIIWWFIITPFMPFSQLEISGMPNIDKEMVFLNAGITEKSSFMNVNTTQIEIALRKVYHFESIMVNKSFPSTLTITIKSAKAVAMAFVQLDGKTTPVYFDKNGVVVHVGKDLTQSLPLISGNVFNEPSLGEYFIPPEFATFLPGLEQIQKGAPDLLLALSEIRIDPRTYGYDLVIYPTRHPVRVRIRESLDREILRYMLLLIDVAASSGSNIAEIDFRSGTASYIPKGASSG
ncbi:MAG: FtsQ-type POTRA domain-containing protein [Spirochaetaceae bacterium]|jgi:cell division protein FtsQ|nr:FtsQ-type POTRA domain-containing protein [Spirochaetaceae bacterium]